MKAYKGFEKDMTCRGFQYVEGEQYEECQDAVLCDRGFHATLEPIDVFGYYVPGESVYHLVDVEDVVGPEVGGDSKIAGRRIKIGAKLELPALIKAQVDFVMENVKKADVPAASNTGDGSAASVSGAESVAIVTGRDSKARGARGCWIVLTERDSSYYRIVEVRAVKVDGRAIKADTFYSLRGGEVVEV